MFSLFSAPHPKITPSRHNLFILHDFGLSDQTKDKKIEDLESSVKKLEILFSALKEERENKSS